MTPLKSQVYVDLLLNDDKDTAIKRTSNVIAQIHNILTVIKQCVRALCALPDSHYLLTAGTGPCLCDQYWPAGRSGVFERGEHRSGTLARQ